MPTNTPNFGLIKPGQEEFYNVNVSNENMDIIDLELKRISEDSGGVEELQQELTSHKADYLKHTGYAVATGSANAYIATLNPALSAYAEGVSLRLKINVVNTGASTINVNGLGAKTIKKQNGNVITAGNLKVGLVYTLVYDGTSFILQGEGGEYGTAGAANVLSGLTIGTEDGVVPGTMLNNGNVGVVSLTTQNQAYVIPSGFHNGLGKVQATYQAGVPNGKRKYNTTILGADATINVNPGFVIGVIWVTNTYGSRYLAVKDHTGAWVHISPGNYAPFPDGNPNTSANIYLYKNGGTHYITIYEA